MKWVNVAGGHWNTDLMQAFNWSHGRLSIWWHGDAENPEIYVDPDGAKYKQLCLGLGLAPVEVVSGG